MSPPSHKERNFDKREGAVLDNESIYLLTHCFSCVMARVRVLMHSHSFRHSPKYSFEHVEFAHVALGLVPEILNPVDAKSGYPGQPQTFCATNF